MTKPVTIPNVSSGHTLSARLLAEADNATGRADGLTSISELDTYLSAHDDVRRLVPVKLLGALRHKIEQLAGPEVRASADSVLAERTVTAEQAAALLEPGDRVVLPVGHMAPSTILAAMDARARTPGQLDPKNPVKIFGALVFADAKLYDSGTIAPEAFFVDGSSRAAIATGRGTFVPSFLHRVPRLIKDGSIPVDKAIVRVSLPDADGYVSLGTSAVVEPAAIASAKTVIAEMSPNVPRVGGACRVHISELDYIVRSDAPVKPLPPTPTTPNDAAIANNIVPLIPDGATLQFGVGGVPNAVAGLLASQNRKGFHIHTEMISDGIMELTKAGAIDGDVQFSFAAGSADLLKWMDGNTRLIALPVDVCNDPAALSKIDKLVAINTALRVDLNGQANAQMINGSWYSGVGGQVDFMRGASESRGGRAILALPSTKTVTDKNGQARVISTIVPNLGEDDVVTTSMHDIQYVVTEHGVAHLEGKNSRERAQALIAIADPQFRPELQKALDERVKRVAMGARPHA